MERKDLSEMSLEELWQLFPIVLTEHKTCWSAWYREEEALLKAALATEPVVRISHIGSTAIEGIWAKPIVDILIEITQEGDFSDCKDRLCGAGYRCMAQDEKRLSFNKGYTPDGFAPRVFHVHLRRAGDCDEIYFRDYLNAHPEVAKAYEGLKLGLWKPYEHDRDGYTREKTAFVKAWTAKAKAEHGA